MTQNPPRWCRLHACQRTTCDFRATSARAFYESSKRIVRPGSRGWPTKPLSPAMRSGKALATSSVANALVVRRGTTIAMQREHPQRLQWARAGRSRQSRNRTQIVVRSSKSITIFGRKSTLRPPSGLLINSVRGSFQFFCLRSIGSHSGTYLDRKRGRSRSGQVHGQADVRLNWGAITR